MNDENFELRRPVVVKVVMTPQFRQQLQNEAKDTLARLERDMKLIEGIPVPRPPQAERQHEQLVRTRAQVEWRLREIDGVEDGAELPYRTFDGPTSIRKGDNFLKKMGQAEIVLKDWEVVELRGV